VHVQLEQSLVENVGVDGRLVSAQHRDLRSEFVIWH
jgi:hypothetical protein